MDLSTGLNYLIRIRREKLLLKNTLDTDVTHFLQNVPNLQ